MRKGMAPQAGVSDLFNLSKHVPELAVSSVTTGYAYLPGVKVQELRKYKRL